MEIGYREALDQLQSMFQDCDIETIKAVLASNNGHVERTIEDLLKMTSEAGGEEPDDDNLFADYNQNNKPKANRNDDLFGIDDEPKGNRFEDLGIFQDNPSRPKPDSNLRSQQEKADAELAYRLQKEEIAYEKEIERQQSRQQSRRSNNNAQPVGISQQWEFSAPNQQAAYRNGQPQGQSQPQMPPQESGDKKKGGIMNKVKTGISSIFNKTKPKPKGPTHNPGQYAEIDNLDDQQEIYQFSNSGQSNQNMGLHQFQGDNNNNNYEDAPMQLSDILNPRGMSNMRNDSDEEDNNNRNNNNYRNNNGGGISNDHFDFH